MSSASSAPNVRLSIPTAANNKKRKLLFQASTPTATTSQFTLQHQVSSLHFGYNGGSWRCYGRTVLYVTAAADCEVADSSRQQQQLAFHLRGCCSVEDVQVEYCCIGDKQLATLPVSFYHVDPLQHVLVRPFIDDSESASTSNTEDDSYYKFDADSQSSRGASGMTTGLRAASIASNLGELRVLIETKARVAITASSVSATTATAAVWRSDLERVGCCGANTGGGAAASGAVQERLQAVLQERAVDRRMTRLDLVASRLADATCSNDANNKDFATNRAFKVTISYSVTALENQDIADHHLAGLQAIASGRTPHVYTVTGVYGDHEGPRCWVPVLDSAAVQHRASQCLTVAVTAPATAGLSVAGCGEDFGVTETVLHDATSDPDAVKKELGMDQFEKIVTRHPQNAFQLVESGPGAAHIIPPEQQQLVSLDLIQATTVWCSHTWTPIPCRSLGFAIGPFKVLEDPEYFGPSAFDDKDDDDEEEEGGKETFEDRLAAFLEKARRDGEGIRQVYFAPLFERKFIHTRPCSHVNMDLLPNTTLRLLPLTVQQMKVADDLDKTVTFATIGVPHRALSLMRDVLAVPTYRTNSYTQIWIPNAVHGGCTSGALHNCPEVLANPFLGGAVMDSRLLPPVGSRLPFYQGGRVLQFLQARCAVRGWVTAALPIGGHDDVGTGYLFALVESFIMSLYERGHGGQGEGML
jgi:hypothetical protein